MGGEDERGGISADAEKKADGVRRTERMPLLTGDRDERLPVSTDRLKMRDEGGLDESVGSSACRGLSRKIRKRT